jgi:hypothetical protein
MLSSPSNELTMATRREAFNVVDKDNYGEQPVEWTDCTGKQPVEWVESNESSHSYGLSVIA